MHDGQVWKKTKPPAASTAPSEQKAKPSKKAVQRPRIFLGSSQRDGASHANLAALPPVLHEVSPTAQRSKPATEHELKPKAETSKFGNDIFIVHGHDEAAKESVARFTERLSLRTIILHEQPSAGRTIVEKFEYYSNVGFAVVLLTPDDIGASKVNKDETRPRARQNVILELGYFMGKLGRGRVCALYKEGVEIPSDYQGVLYIPMDSAGAWRMALAKEIKNAGIEVDLNKL